MANPFSNIVQGARRGFLLQQDPQRLQREDAAKATSIFLDQLAGMDQNQLPPQLRQLVQLQGANPAQVLSNPEALAGLGGTETLTGPAPKVATPSADVQTVTEAQAKAAALEAVGDTETAALLRKLAGNTASRTKGTARPPERIIAIDGENPLNAQYQLGIPKGERARVRLSLGADNEVINAGLASATPPSSGADGGSFGNSLRGRALNIVTSLAPVEAAGQLTPEQSRDLDTALAVAQEPTSFQNPVTGAIEQRALKLPPFAQTIADRRDVRGSTSPEMEADDTAEIKMSPRADRLRSALAALPSGNTIFDQADNLTGPDSFIARNISKVPGLGGLTSEATDAESVAQDVTELLVDALRTERTESSKAITEVNDLRERFGITPEVINTPERLRAVLSQRDIMLADREQAIIDRLGGRSGKISIDQRRRDLNALVRIQQVRPMLSPPVLTSEEEITSFVESNPPGTRFVMRNPLDASHPWVVVRVKAKTKTTEVEEQ